MSKSRLLYNGMEIYYEDGSLCVECVLSTMSQVVERFAEFSLELNTERYKTKDLITLRRDYPD